MNSFFAERANSLNYDPRLRSRADHFGRGNVLESDGLVADANGARRTFRPEDVVDRHLGRKPKEVCSFCPGNGNPASGSLCHCFGDGFRRRGEQADLGVYLRELVNAASQTTNLPAPVKPGQSLIHSSTGSEVRELSGSKDKATVPGSDSLQDRIGRRRYHVVLLRQKEWTIYMTMSSGNKYSNILIYNAIQAYCTLIPPSFNERAPGLSQ